jgi:N-acetylmuramoyl-L-alanine amidase
MRLLKTYLVLTLLCLVALPSFCFAHNNLPLLGHKIAIDPGHGGVDPGANRDGLLEDELVLDLGLRLRTMLAAQGATVYLTRETDTDLADQKPGNGYSSRKKQDIMRRVELVNGWQPDLFLSLHVNASGSSRWRGAQVFFRKDSDSSMDLAKSVQLALIKVLGNTTRQAKPGDYRILNDTVCPAALVEIGFISNPEEAALLCDAAYREKIAWAICLGICNWLNQEQTQIP